MNKQFNLAYFAGGSKFTIDPFLALLASKHKVKIVFTKEPKRSGRGRKKTHNYLIGEVIKKNIKFIALDNFLNLENIKELNTLDLDFIIVFSFGVILPKEILDIPKYGCINLHTSILPKWRGASPIQHTLLNNEKYAGYSLFIMNEKLDEGDIIFKEKILIEDRDNYEILLNKIIKLASKSLVIKIEEFVNNNINIEKQDSNSATYCYRIRKEDTYISLNSSSKEVYGKIRAFSPSPGAKFFLQ